MNTLFKIVADWEECFLLFLFLFICSSCFPVSQLAKEKFSLGKKKVFTLGYGKSEMQGDKKIAHLTSETNNLVIIHPIFVFIHLNLPSKD